jgi:hypothetical protein
MPVTIELCDVVVIGPSTTAWPDAIEQFEHGYSPQASAAERMDSMLPTDDPIGFLSWLENIERTSLSALKAFLTRDGEGPYDRAYARFRAKVGRVVDLTQRDHADALFDFLQDWRVRGLANDTREQFCDRIADWASENQRHLPSQQSLHSSASAQLDAAARHFTGLAALPARKGRTRMNPLGPTGASKTLWVLRPSLYLPWDRATRDGAGFAGTTAGYRALLMYAQRIILRMAAAFECEPPELGRHVERNELAPPKLVDEILFRAFTERRHLNA